MASRMKSSNKNKDNFQELVCLGFRAFPKHLRKYILIQWFIFAVMFLFYLRINGGLWPRFLPNFNQLRNSGHVLSKNDGPLSPFIVETGDGLSTKFLHDVNSKSALQMALTSNVHVIAGDVMLKGQDSQQQQLVPVMARTLPAAASSDVVTMTTWLDSLLPANKVLLLNFRSDNSVELSLQIIQEKANKQANSLILCANIVNGPNHALSKDKLISAKRFLHLTSTLLPESKLCTGWLTTVVLDEKENALAWPEVIEMLDALRREKIDLSKVTFIVEAAVCAGSIPSIRWLLDITGGSLIVHASADVSAKVDHLLFIRKSLPADRVLYNVHNSLRTEFSAHPDSFPANKRENEKENNEEVHLNDWALLDVSDGEGNKIFQSKHVIVMQHGSVGTKLLYMLPNKLESADTQAVFSCKLEFVTTAESSDKNMVRDDAGLAKGVEFCFADPTSSTKSQECGFVGMDGNFKIYKAGDAKPYAANKFTADEIGKRKNSRQQCFVVSFMYSRTKLSFLIILPERCSDDDSKFLITKQLEVRLKSDSLPTNFAITASLPSNSYIVLEDLNYHAAEMTKVVSAQ